MNKTVTISLEEYEELLEESRFLNCLQINGVDNWEWYGEACSMFNEYKNKKEED